MEIMNFFEQTRQNYAGRVRLMPGRLPVCTQEGVHAVDEAIRFLRHARPFPALALSPGLCSAAADHCRESRLAVSSDITGAMGAMQEAELVTA